MKATASSLGKKYRQIYDFLCGTHPNPHPWHFQWLSSYYLRRDLQQILPNLTGSVLDVGCGAKPYATLLTNTHHHVGIDVEPGPGVDDVVSPESPWPYADAAFDGVMATQVLEHVQDPNKILNEVARVIKPGGTVVLSFPFLYNVHGAPHDYQRFTVHGARNLLPDMAVISVIAQGGIGSSLATLALNWIDATLNQSLVSRAAKAVILPAWLPFAFVSNLSAWLLDLLDSTDAFYSNVIIVLRAP